MSDMFMKTCNPGALVIREADEQIFIFIKLGLN